MLAIPSVRERLTDEDRARALDAPDLPHAVHEALLETLYASGADILILPIQDVFGWRDRINQPATVSDGNWTWRLPWPADRLSTEPAAMAVANQLREWAHGTDVRSAAGFSRRSSEPRLAILAQVSFSVTVRLKTGAPGRGIGIDAEVALALELKARARAAPPRASARPCSR